MAPLCRKGALAHQPLTAILPYLQALSISTLSYFTEAGARLGLVEASIN